MVDVFISYARVEGEFAHKVKDLLEGMGLNVFFDVEGIDGGDVFPDVFDHAIKTAGCVVSLWSPLSLSRPWVKKECYIGQTRGVLLPIAIAPLDVQKDVPAIFMDTQFLDLVGFTGDPGDARWKKVVHSLARTLKRPDLVPGDAELQPHKKAETVDLRAEMLEMRKQLEQMRQDAEQDDDDAERDKPGKDEPRPKRDLLAPALATLKALPQRLPEPLRKPPVMIGAALALLVLVAGAFFLAQPRGGADNLVKAVEKMNFDSPDFRLGEAWGTLRKTFSVADFDAASEKSSKVATILASAYAQGIDGLKYNATQVRTLDTAACRAGVQVACNDLGVTYVIDGNFDEGNRLFEDACKANQVSACTNLGRAYLLGQGFQRNATTASTYFDKACKAGYATGCYQLGMLYENGAGVPGDIDKARALLEQSCTGREWMGCVELSNLYGHGVGVRQDTGKAFDLVKTACDNGLLQGCDALAAMYAEGAGTKTDFTMARTLYEKSCKSDDPEGCRGLGLMYQNGDGVQKDFIKARDLFKTACDEFDVSACVNLGFALHDGGQNTPPDYPGAFLAFTQVCAAGNFDGCSDMARMYNDGDAPAAEMVKALPMFEQACLQAHDGVSCNDLGVVYAKGDIVPKDMQRAHMLFDSACNAVNTANGVGCRNAKRLAAAGDAADFVPETSYQNQVFAQPSANLAAPGSSTPGASAAQPPGGPVTPH